MLRCRRSLVAISTTSCYVCFLWTVHCLLDYLLNYLLTYMWPLRGWSVRYGSTNLANSAFHTVWVGKWVVIHGLLGWRPLNGRPVLHVAVRRRLYARTVCDVQRRCSCSCRLCCAFTFLPFTYSLVYSFAVCSKHLFWLVTRMLFSAFCLNIPVNSWCLAAATSQFDSGLNLGRLAKSISLGGRGLAWHHDTLSDKTSVLCRSYRLPSCRQRILVQLRVQNS